MYRIERPDTDTRVCRNPYGREVAFQTGEERWTMQYVLLVLVLFLERKRALLHTTYINKSAEHNRTLRQLEKILKNVSMNSSRKNILKSHKHHDGNV